MNESFSVLTSTTSLTFAERIAKPKGDSLEILPSTGLDSSEPTIVTSNSSSSSKYLILTVLPKLDTLSTFLFSTSMIT